MEIERFNKKKKKIKMNSSRTHEVARGEREAIVCPALSMPFITSSRNVRKSRVPLCNRFIRHRSGNLIQSRPASLMNTR